MLVSGKTMKGVIIRKFRNSNHTLMDERGNRIKVVIIQNQKNKRGNSTKLKEFVWNGC